MSEGILTIDLGFVNAYLLGAGGRFVLVDTGLSSQWPRLRAALETANCSPELLALVVISHADTDHAGNARRLQEEWRVPIAVHAADAGALETGVAPPRKGRGSLAQAVMGLMGFMRRLGGGAMAPTLKPDILLHDGQSLCDWELDARVIHLPGHTPGAIALLLKGGSLIAGDVFANRSKPDISPFIENFDAYRASLLKAKSLAASIVTVYPGHGPSFPGSAIPDIEL
jgi:glyoxylase-like metal-dependent hydrolase (beta-lactamase superfamily II)